MQFIVISVFISFSGIVLAAGVPVLGAPTPTQSYESVHSAPVKTLKTEKRTIKLKSHSEVVNELESQMNALNQATLLYQQDTNQKIEHLSRQNAAVQAKLEKLTEAMMMINQQLSALNNTHATHSLSLHKKNNPFKYLAFGFVLFLAMILGVLISRQRKLTNQ